MYNDCTKIVDDLSFNFVREDPSGLILEREASTLTVARFVLFEDDFTSCSRWQSEDSFFSKIVKIVEIQTRVKR